jgi:hypothetical protein
MTMLARMLLLAMTGMLAAASAGLGARQSKAPPPGDSTCRHDGEIVRDPNLLPPIPRSQITTEFTGPVSPGWSIGNPCVSDSPPASLRDGPPGVLPPASGTVLVEARVDARGCVTSVCIVRGLSAEYDKALAARLKRDWYYHPARLGQQPVPTVVTARIEAKRLPSGSPIADSTDVGWLETIAGTPEGAADYMRDRGVRFGQPKDWRISAFARLGDLGTTESLAAVRRIEAAGMASTPAPDRVRLGVTPAVGWHMTDGQLRVVAEARSPDGTTYAVVVGNLVGGRGLFLTSTRDASDPAGWTRPKRIPALAFRGSHSPSLSWKAPGVLRLSFVQDQPPPRHIMEGTLGPGPTPPARGRQTLDVVIAGVLRDSDKDGWTDVEEEQLGLDPRNPDTDGDGVPDGRDVCPNYAPTAADRADESVTIIQKAVFAVFGLSRSREPLFPGASSRKVQLSGYQAPVIYGHPPPQWGMTSSPAGTPEGLVFVRWKIARQTETEAVVVLSDTEGPLAGGGQDVYLERKQGEWFVVARVTTWIS